MMIESMEQNTYEAFFDDFFNSDENIAESNKSYISDPTKALQLLETLLAKPSRNERGNTSRRKRLGEILEQCFPTDESQIHLTDEISLMEKAQKLKAKILLDGKIEMLTNYNVIGVCGRFSAGKSHFINSLLNDNYLPEDITSSTAIPTYIMWGAEENIFAYTKAGSCKTLKREMLQAMSHEFEQQYHIAFSSLIDTIVIQTPAMPYKNLLFLDTPGYNAADMNRQKANRDIEKACEELAAADGIICLVSVEDGDVLPQDIHFLNRVKCREKPLVVINKRDLKSDDDVRAVCTQAKSTLENSELDFYALTSYSASFEVPELDNTNFCNDYISHVQNLPEDDQNIEEQVKEFINEIIQQVQAQLSEFTEQLENDISALTLYPDPLHAQAIVAHIDFLQTKINNLRLYNRTLQKLKY